MRGSSPLDEARFQGRLWTPARDPTQVTRWYDASDLTTLTVNASNQCTTWKDKSRNKVNATQAAGSTCPTLTFTSVFAPFPALQFTQASAQRMDFTALTAGDATVIALVERNSNATTNRTIVSGQASSSNQVRFNTSHQLELLKSGIASIGTSGTVPLGEALVVGQTAPSSANRWHVNGTMTTGGTSQTWTAGIARVGANYDAGEAFDGAIAEVIIFQGVMSLTRIKRIEGYLAWKWGAPNLLGERHPYRRQPPLLGT